MRRVRVTFPGAFHHAMAHGYANEKIFADRSSKARFLDILDEKAPILKIRILAYCILDNHYHLVLQNCSNRLSEFFKQVNGEYGIFFRKKNGGVGYVFQDRFQSKLIQEDSYLIAAISYVLMNPVSAGLARNFLDYPWSSAFRWESSEPRKMIDKEFLMELFGSSRGFVEQVHRYGGCQPKVVRTELGDVIGSEAYMQEALIRFERRREPDGLWRNRSDDRYFDPIEKVYQEFERINGVKVADLDLSTFDGKRLRGRLLLLLRDKAGLKYEEIARLDLFGNLQYASLGKLYQDAKKRVESNPLRSQEVKHRP